jgi:hypothetical protein
VNSWIGKYFWMEYMDTPFGNMKVGYAKKICDDRAPY